MNKKPPELHVVDGTKPAKKNAAKIPDNIKRRIPSAEWMDNPDAFDKQRFIDETAEFLFTVYGIGNAQDKHTITLLADQIQTYVECQRGIMNEGLVSVFNNGKTIGPSPYLTIRNKATTLIVQLMNELGLTPRSRLASGKSEDESPLTKFMQGPLAS